MPGSNQRSDSRDATNTPANSIPPEPALNPAQQEAYDEARAKVLDHEGKPTAQYRAYLRYEAEYKRKVEAWHKAYAAASSDPMKLQNWPIDGMSYQDNVDKAMERWVSLGHKREIENAIAILTAQGTDPVSP